MSSHRLGHEPFGEARYQWPCTRNRLLYRGKRQGRLMARLVSPHFGDPDRVSVRRVPGDDVAAAARHRARPVQENRDESVSLPGHRFHSSNQAVHRVSVRGYHPRRVRRALPSYILRRSHENDHDPQRNAEAARSARQREDACAQQQAWCRRQSIRCPARRHPEVGREDQDQPRAGHRSLGDRETSTPGSSQSC